MPHTVHLHRVLTTTPEKVYRAFVEADALAKWLPPNGFACTVHQLDAKVGGTFRMSFRNFTTGNSHSFGGEYVELVPHERLRYRRPQLARSNSGDSDTQESLTRHRAKHRSGRLTRHHSTGGLLSRLAGVAAKLGEACRARNQSRARRL
jgi:uncharacterized protein YndB with AHSA1/START domain